MSSGALTSTSYAVLVLVGRNGAGPHDLVKMARQGRVYESPAESQYYAEPKRLERLGYLRSRKVPGQTHERTLYELTPKAVEALEEWLAIRPAPPRVAADPILRLLAADLVGEALVRESLLRLRDEVVDLNARLDVADAAAETLPHRAKYLRLNHRLARRIVDAYATWLVEIERELEPGPGAPDPG
jgi:DNA-binding PadR family transcriptional regulator